MTAYEQIEALVDAYGNLSYEFGASQEGVRAARERCEISHAALVSAIRPMHDDAARYRYLTDDLAGAAREQRNALLERLSVMSYRAASMAIDAARSAASAPAEGK